MLQFGLLKLQSPEDEIAKIRVTLPLNFKFMMPDEDPFGIHE